MTRRKKMFLAAALALMMAASVSVPALAIGSVDPTQTGSLTLDIGEAEQRADMEAHEAAVDVAVYRVADIDENGLFTLTEKFSALAEGWEQQLGPKTDMEALTERVLAVVLAEPAEPDGEPEALIEPDATAEGVSVVGGKIELLAGLYLLIPSEAETEQFAYTFSPMLLAVPSVGTAEGEPEGERDWQYSYTVYMKPEQSDRLGRLEISKALASYNETLGPTTFVFQVEGMKDGEKVYSNVVSLTFSGAGTQSVTLEDVPVGAAVTVTEVYSGASYAVSGAGTVEVTIPDLDLPEGENVARAGFTNDYTDRLIPDASVVNTFVYNGAGWTWQSGEEAEG